MAMQVGSSGLVLSPCPSAFFKLLFLVKRGEGYKGYLRTLRMTEGKRVEETLFSKIVQVVVVPGKGRDF